MITAIPTCRLCGAKLSHTFADLGMSPLANSYLPEEKMNTMEPFYPLHVWVCHECFLVQLEELRNPEHIFSDYAYFSSYSVTWVEHARKYCELVLPRFGLDSQSLVVEVASNDGYLLQFFKQQGIPVLGVEPASNVAAAAQKNGIPTRELFFGAATARGLVAEGLSADLLVANNVLAHVPDILSFIEGMKILLKPDGVITVEFPHLLQLMANCQFDTIYHEHYSYLSLVAVENALARFDLSVFDIDQLPTHGGSLRVYAKHGRDNSKQVSDRVVDIRDRENQAGLKDVSSYQAFSRAVPEIKCALLEFLIRSRREGKRVVAYGAPAKGNTLLNYCGVGPELLEYTVDVSPHKQGHFLPGTHLPIYAPEKIVKDRPDYVLILPWNLRDEISTQMAVVRSWGGQFVVPIPALEIF